MANQTVKAAPDLGQRTSSIQTHLSVTKPQATAIIDAIKSEADQRSAASGEDVLKCDLLVARQRFAKCAGGCGSITLVVDGDEPSGVTCFGCRHEESFVSGHPTPVIDVKALRSTAGKRTSPLPVFPGKEVETLSVEELAMAWGCSKTKVYRMAQSGELPRTKIGHHVRFRVADVEAWMKQHSHQRAG